MSDAMFSDPQIKGLRPAQGRRQVGERFVMDGRNFMLDVEGPHSEFGTDLMFHEIMYSPEGAQTLEVNDQTFIVNDEGFFAYNTTANVLYPVYVFATMPTGDFPWSMALVGSKYYFSRKGVAAIIEYDPVTSTWTSFTLNVPTNPHGVCEAGGRLTITGESYNSWSAIDDGQNLATSTTTGAGSQLLALVGAGTVYGVFPTADGCITYTSSGLMKTEVINSVNPFRHYRLVKDIVPINQFNIVEIENEHIFLAESGFFKTAGKKPQPWQPLMGEYFHKTVFKDHDFSNITHIRMWYNYHRQWMFVSIVDGSGNDYLYDYAYGLYLPRGDEWGMFNRQHYSIGEYWLDGVEFESYNAGYISATGHVHKFTDTAGVEIPVDGSHWLNHGPYEIPAYHDGTNYRFVTTGQFYPERYLINLPTQGVYTLQVVETALSPDPVSAPASAVAVGTVGEDWLAMSSAGDEDWLALTAADDEDWLLGDDGLFSTSGEFGAAFTQYTPTIVPPVYNPLDSAITVGLYRLTDQLVPDRYSFVTNILVGSKTGDDYNISITGTLDGTTALAGQVETPLLVKSVNEMDFYSCYNNGVYHYIDIDATTDSQSFHLKLLETDGILGGRI